MSLSPLYRIDTLTKRQAETAVLTEIADEAWHPVREKMSELVNDQVQAQVGSLVDDQMWEGDGKALR